MQEPFDRETLRHLRTIPNVGPAISRDLVRIGITDVEDLRGRDPDELYHALCRLNGACPDPCVHDTFAAAVAYATTGDASPWWAFTPARKARSSPITPPEMTPTIEREAGRRRSTRPPS